MVFQTKKIIFKNSIMHLCIFSIASAVVCKKKYIKKNKMEHYNRGLLNLFIFIHRYLKMLAKLKNKTLSEKCLFLLTN